MENDVKYDDENPPNLKTKSFKYRQYLAAFIVTLLSISNGLSATWSSPVRDTLLSSSGSPLGNPITEELFSWIVSVLYIGGFVGIFFWRKCADKFGRKINGYLISSTQIIGWMGIILASTPTHLIVSRFIMGLGGCGIISNSQLYINETADENIKGPLCALILVFNNVGIVLMSVLGSCLRYDALNKCCLCVPVIFILLYFWLPETPYYLSMARRPNEARKSMNLFELEELTGNEISTKASFKELFSTGEMRTITFVGMGLIVCQQFSGISAVLAYSNQIFELPDSPISEDVSSIIVASFQLVMSVISGPVIKSSRRKPLLLFAHLWASLSYFLIFLSLCSLVNWYVLKFAPIFGILSFIAVYNLGIGPLPLVIFPEMFPQNVLNHGISLALVVLVFAAFIVTKTFALIESIFQKSGSFLILSCLNLSFGLFVWQFLRETKPTNKKRNSGSVN